MRTINSILCASLAFASLCGCEILDSKGVNLQETDDVSRLTVYLGGGQGTRALGQTISFESTVQNVQVFVFRSGGDNAGLLDACASRGFDSPLNFDASQSSYSGITLDCTAGDREVWAIINGPQDFTADGSVGSRDALIAKTSALGENAANSLFMTGSKTATLNPGSASVNITVYRACASVILESVRNEMTAAVYRKENSFRLKGAYLINVPAKISYDYSLAPAGLDASDWYAKSSKETDSSRSALIYDGINDEYLNYGTAYTTVHTFYSYPNDCQPVTDAVWSPRATRLVVEAEYSDGSTWHTCYYPVTLFKDGEGPRNNCQYRVNLVVKRPGSDNPDVPVEFNTMTGDITVADWSTGATYSESI